MTLEATSEVILPVGTEITITKINWYAILFYCLLAFVSAWYYMYSKSAKEEEVEVKKPEPTKEEPPKSS
jgi:prolipoprotein diacylglyceryltransferase